MAMFSFDATIVQRWPSRRGYPQVQVRPDDVAAYLRQCREAGLMARADWHDDQPLATISRRALVERCEGTNRVRCTVQVGPTGGLRWIDVEPLPGYRRRHVVGWELAVSSPSASSYFLVRCAVRQGRNRGHRLTNGSAWREFPSPGAVNGAL